MDRKKITLAALAAVAVLAAIYFVPTKALTGILPAAAVKYRIVGPLATLTLAGIFHLPWQMTLAMAFSLVGDWMGAYGSFIGQMGFFALAHVMLISFFGGNLISGAVGRPGVRKVSLISLVFLLFFTAAMIWIIPDAPAGVIRCGCVVYAALICVMTVLAQFQGKWLFALGAFLFLISDTFLAYNKFVEPLDGSRWLVMIPYYSGQVMLWLGAARKS